MEIVDFSDKFFKDIPEQDNPAFSLNKFHNCILLHKTQKYHKVADGVTVSLIAPVFAEDGALVDTVTKLAHFYNYYDALNYAEFLKENK